jgi:hemolysin III
VTLAWSNRAQIAPVSPPPRLRLTGTEGCPTWRGRLHLVATALAVPAAAALIARRPDPTVIVYAIALVVQFAISAAYHLLPMEPPRRRRFRQADHAMIYVFTAASLAAFCRFAVGGPLGLAVTVAGWVGAAAGVAMKLGGFERARVLGAAWYFVLGWLAAITLPRAVGRLGALDAALLGSVALLYSLGAAVLCSRRPDPRPQTFGYHEIWHAAVIVASACYFTVLWSLASPAH